MKSNSIFSQSLLHYGIKRRALALMLAGVVPAGAAAQEDGTSDAADLYEVVVTGELSDFSATKLSAPIVETARSISIEPAELFIEKGALNLSQTTSYLSGIISETFGFATRGDWIYSRGVAIPRYRDSIQELFGSYNTTRAEIFTIEQVEVLKGPASVLYGQGSPGGIVNYVSKTPKAEANTEIVGEFGTHDRRQVALDSTGAIPGSDGKWLYRLVALDRDADTQVAYVDDNTTVVMPSLTYMPSDDTKFTLIGLYQNTDSDTGSQFIPVEGTLFPLSDGSSFDQDVYAGEPGFNRFDTESRQVTFLAKHQINDVFAINATALWRDGEADYHQAWPIFTGAGASRYLNSFLPAPLFPSTTVARSFYQADNTSEQYAADVRLTAEFTTGDFSHEVLMGVQYQDVATDSNRAYFYGGGALDGDFSFALDLANPVYTGAPDQAVFDAIYADNPEQKVEDIGYYLSDQISYGNWRFTAGLRYDQVDNDDGTEQQQDEAVSLSAGVLYYFDNGLAPYVSYAESFETVVGTSLSGAQLDPEEGRQYEVGLKYQPDSFPGLFTVSYFDIEISNLPNPDSLPADAAQQQGVSEITGVELEGKFSVGDFYLQAALSWLDAEDPNGFELPSQADRLASIWVTWRPSGALNRLRAGVGVRHVGESVSEDGTVRYETPDYTLGDLMVGYELSDQWDFAVNVKNVTDKEYLTSCLTRGDCFPGVRRTVTGSVRYRF